ncbi:uncharacterized protein LOC131956002 [Physella acuta]|uniref:uncharacterized protein LOC131956002 n=1 Tax=Physella acuta TaxID=109671 RepID=UPI0027DDEF27|nr:uncharacterized protein LOC131956002 [Physella acuta]
MTSLCASLLPLLLVCVGLLETRACDPAQEFTTVTFNCTDTTPSNDLHWTFDTTPVSTCTNATSSTCRNQTSIVYNTTRANGFSTLTIVNVTRSHVGVWNCSYLQTPALFSCPLKLFSPPVVPVCTKPRLVNYGSYQNIKVVCTASKVYPQADCRFHMKQPGESNFSIATGSKVESNKTQSDPEYYATTCTLEVKWNTTLNGNWSFFVQMWPNITAPTNVKMNSSVESIELDPVLPEVRLNKNCFDGKVMQHYLPYKKINCTCELATPGLPPGQAYWVDSSRNWTQDSSPNLIISYTQDNRTLVCASRSVLGNGKNVTFSPKFAVPAEVVKFTANDVTILEVDNGTEVTFQCDVSSEPPGSLSIRHEGTNGTITDRGRQPLYCQDIGMYVCEAWNSIIPQVLIRRYVQVYVLCEPTLDQDNSRTGQLTRRVGHNATVQFCITGYPPPSGYKILKPQHLANITTTMTNLSQSYSDSFLYTVVYIPIRINAGCINFTIYNIQERDFANYSLIIYNDALEEVTYTFEIIKEKRETESSDAGAIAGGVIAALVIIVLIVVLVLHLRRRGVKLNCKKISFFRSARKNNRNRDVTSNVYGNDAVVKAVDKRDDEAGVKRDVQAERKKKAGKQKEKPAEKTKKETQETYDSMEIGPVYERDYEAMAQPEVDTVYQN